MKNTPQNTSIVIQLQMNLGDLQRLYYGTKLGYPHAPNAPSLFPIMMYKVNELAAQGASALKTEEKEKIADALMYIRSSSDKEVLSNNPLISTLVNTARIGTNFKNLLAYYEDHKDQIQNFSRGVGAFQELKSEYSKAREAYASKAQEEAIPIKPEKSDPQG